VAYRGSYPLIRLVLFLRAWPIIYCALETSDPAMLASFHLEQKSYTDTISDQPRRRNRFTTGFALTYYLR
jgi:hypothetical protein